MINETKVQEILEKVKAEWKKKYKEQYELSNVQQTLLAVEENIRMCPYEDGCQRVKSLRTGHTYKVPLSDMILHGLKESEIEKYDVLEEPTDITGAEKE